MPTATNDGVEIAVETNVSNAGTVESTQTVTLSINGSEAASREVTVPADDNVTEAFTTRPSATTSRK